MGESSRSVNLFRVNGSKVILKRVPPGVMQMYVLLFFVVFVIISAVGCIGLQPRHKAAI